MPELRKDYFTKKLVLVSEERSKRPLGYHTQIHAMPDDRENCPFCPGNEEQTPPADLVLVSKENTLLKLADSDAERVSEWSVRYFPNSFPAVSPDSEPKYSDYPLQGEPALGYHHVMVVSPDHDATFSTLPQEQWIDVLATLQDRVRWLYAKKTVGYVSVFVNNGYEPEATGNYHNRRERIVAYMPPVIDE